MIGNTWIHSQETSDSTKVSYFRLGEFAKYVDYKKEADSSMASKDRQIKSLTLAYESADKRVKRYKDSIVPTYEFKLLERQLRLDTAKEKYDLTREKYEAQLNAKKGNWLRGFFTGTGIVATIFTALLLFGG